MNPKYASSKAFAEALMSKARKDANPHYKLSDPVNIDDPNLQSMIRKFIGLGDSTVEALKDAKQNYATKNLRSTRKEMSDDPATWNVEMYDEYKKAVQDIAGKLIDDKKIIPKNGKLVIFEDEVHYTSKQNCDHDRIIIAGNVK